MSANDGAPLSDFGFGLYDEARTLRSTSFFKGGPGVIDIGLIGSGSVLLDFRAPRRLSAAKRIDLSAGTNVDLGSIALALGAAHVRVRFRADRRLRRDVRIDFVDPVTGLVHQEGTDDHAKTLDLRTYPGLLVLRAKSFALEDGPRPVRTIEVLVRENETHEVVIDLRDGGE